MTTALRSILLTPNLLGKDGVSTLSREVSRALPAPSLVLSLHDSAAAADSSADLELRGARGSRIRFLADVARAMPRVTPETVVVCTHLHLAPAARMLAWRGQRATIILCGIEAWVSVRPAERWAIAGGEVVAISQHTVGRFKAANPALASIDVVVCHPGLPAKSPSQGAWPAAPECSASPTALIVARMSAAERYKGHDALLDVWPRFSARHPNAVLAIAGDGDDRQRLEARVAALGIAHAVRFLGRVDDDRLDELYRACRLFVMPSRDEGFGLVFLEAMRAGKPCIGGRGAASEIIQHGVTGLIVDPDSRPELTAALERLYSEPDTCQQFGAAGRERFQTTFTNDSFQARFRKAIGRRTLVTLAASMP
jgi:phosphatidylinositol alpha-1,6-mannosyltransferase